MLVNKFRELIKENFADLKKTIREVIEENCENTGAVFDHGIRVYIDINGNISTTGVVSNNLYLNNEIGENPTMLEVYRFDVSYVFISDDDLPCLSDYLEREKLQKFKKYISQCEGIDMDDIEMKKYMDWEYYKDFNFEEYEKFYNATRKYNINILMDYITDYSYFDPCLENLQKNISMYKQ